MKKMQYIANNKMGLLTKTTINRKKLDISTKKK